MRNINDGEKYKEKDEKLVKIAVHYVKASHPPEQ